MSVIFQTVSLKPRKGVSGALGREYQRNWSEKAWKVALEKGNYDRARGHLNFEIVGGKIQPVDKSKSIGKKMAENLAARGIKDPNEGRDKPYYRTVGDLVLSGNHDRMVELAFGDQSVTIKPGNNTENLDIKRCPGIEEWAMDMYHFVAGKYGEENIISCIAHLDETTPHLHFAILPVVEGRIGYPAVFGGRTRYDGPQLLKQLHTEVAEVNKKWGLERGTSLTDEKSRGMQTLEYRRQLERDSREKEAELAEMDEQLSGTRQELKVAETRVKALQTMISNQEKKKASLEKELKELQRKLRNDEGDRNALEKEMAEIHDKLQDTEEKLADKRQKLAVAEEKLLAAQAAEKALSWQNSVLQRSVDSLSNDAFAADGITLRLAILDQIIAEHRQMVAALPAGQPSPFDGSTLDLVSKRAVEILYCARLLAIGLIDDATTFAQDHGGGGGGNDMKWGRDEDEDDKHWRRRCIMMACRMMRPVQRVRKR